MRVGIAVCVAAAFAVAVALITYCVANAFAVAVAATAYAT